MKRLPLRRAGVLSLLVAIFALAGASVPPSRGLTGPHTSAIVWEARSTRQAPAVHKARRKVPIASANRLQRSPLDPAPSSSTLVRHALFQRPPPPSQQS